MQPTRKQVLVSDLIYVVMDKKKAAERMLVFAVQSRRSKCQSAGYQSARLSTRLRAQVQLVRASLIALVYTRAQLFALALALHL